MRVEYFIQGEWDSVGRVYDVGRGLPMHTYGSGWEQNFKNHDPTSVSGIYVRNAAPTVSAYVKPDFWAFWQAQGGEAALGLPMSSEWGACPSSMPASCVRYQQFEQSCIWSDGSVIQLCGSDLYIAGSGTPTDYRRFAGGQWLVKGDDSPGNPLKLKYFGNGLMFHRAGNSLRRSTDGGETWTTLAPPTSVHELRDFDKASNSNRLWTVWVNNVPYPRVIDVFYSDDNGSTWSSSFFTAQVGPSQRHKIAVHPTNANLIAVSYDARSGYRPTVRVSQTGGSTWVVYQVSSDNSGNGTNGEAQHQILWTGDHRLVYWYRRSGSARLRIFTNDDYGAGAWIERYGRDGDITPISLIRAGTNGPLFAVISKGGASTDIFLRSVAAPGESAGTYWEVLQSPVNDNDPATGLAYDPWLDRLWVVFDMLPDQPPVSFYYVQNASTRAAGDWLAGFVNVGVPSSFNVFGTGNTLGVVYDP